MTMPRSSRIRCTQAIAVLALPAGSTVKTWPYLFFEVAGLVRPQASQRGRDRRRLQADSRDGAEIHDYGKCPRTRQGMSVYAGAEATREGARTQRAGTGSDDGRHSRLISP